MKDIVQQGLPSSEISIAWKRYNGFAGLASKSYREDVIPTSKFRQFWSMNNG